ncbi:MAG: DUF2961 domain-containing protein [Planctomycetota bacterium]
MTTTIERGTGKALLFVALAAGIPAGGARPTADEAPPGADLRPLFRAAGLAARSQGARPTCSVFAFAGALEFALARPEGEGRPLSVEFLNWAANETTGERQDGAFFADLWRGFAAFGACDEAEAPYGAAFGPDFAPGEELRQRALARAERGLRPHWIKAWDVTTGLAAAQRAEIERVLERGWPVAAGMRWPIVPVWTDGRLAMAPPEGVRDGHSVLLVGYRRDPALPGGGAFLIQNSGSGPLEGWLGYDLVSAYTNDAVWIESGPELDVSLLSPLGPPVVGRNRRASSNEQPAWNDANLDMTWLLPGESVEVPLLRGPGVITHLWLTSHSGWVGELDALALRIWWDGRPEPGVAVPLADFFAVGQGRPAAVESVPVQVSPSGSLSACWRMPFRDSARIVVTNEHPERSTGLYWQVDWVEIAALPAGTPYFHARYRREHPAAAGRDYLVADLAGPGLYAGTVLSVTLAQDGWFGEGDDFFFLDGEEVPSLQGTGTEDYFNDAWGFRPRTGPWCGTPRWEGYATGDSGVAYRWHLADPVCFARSLRLVLEHKGNRAESEDGFYLERPDFFSSVAFWYQRGEPAPAEPLPPWAERRVPWEVHPLVRAFRKAVVSGGPAVRVDTQGFFGARPVLAWPNEAAGAALTLPFALAAGGRFAIRLAAASGPGLGAYDVELDGARILAADFRTAADGELDLPLGVHALAAGDHTVGFRANAAAAPGGGLAVELLRLLPLPPEARREVRTRHEAHFVRLGIGRAVYAYRLAFAAVPASLEELAAAGFLPARYLCDENERPLRSWREDGALHVESAGPEGWRREWRGRDPRR